VGDYGFIGMDLTVSRCAMRQKSIHPTKKTGFKDGRPFGIQTRKIMEIKYLRIRRNSSSFVSNQKPAAKAGFKLRDKKVTPLGFKPKTF
jgi:hypothetical protein